MQTRSELWKRLAAIGTFRLESNAVIGGVEYTAISAPKINRSLFTGNLSVGNCNSATLEFSVLTDDDIPESAEIVIRGRLTDDDVEYTEHKEFGTFFIDYRSVDHGLISLLCYDAMRKAEQAYVDGSEPSEEMEWPKSMSACVEEIAERIGVELDPRTVIDDGEAYQVPYPDKLTMLEVLGYIGACHGGNWIITPQNKLRLVTIIPTPETHYILDHAYNRISTSDGHILVNTYMDTSDDVANPTGGGAVNVPVVIGKIATSKKFFISRVTMTTGEDTACSVGDSTGYELLIEGNPYSCWAICNDLYAKFSGVDYQPFDIENACYDPAAELGDWVAVGSNIHSVLCCESVTLDTGFRSNASAPGKEEVGSEYPFLTAIQKLNKQHVALEKYVEKQDADIRTSIVQTRSEILLQVSSTYITGEDADNTYATKSQVNSSITLLSNSITAEVSRSSAAEESLSSRISIAEENISLKVSKGDVSSQLSVESGLISIKGDRLSIDSTNFKLATDGQVTATGAFISEEVLTVWNQGYTSTIPYRTQFDAAMVNFYAYEELVATVRSEWTIFGGTSLTGPFLTPLSIYGRDGINLYIDNANGNQSQVISLGKDLRFVPPSGKSFQIGAYGPTWLMYDLYLYYGNFTCTGTKNRAVDTEHYGTVGLNAMESATAVFADMGEVTLDGAGYAEVFLDPIFAETVDINHVYHVFTSTGQVYSIDKYPEYFVVNGEPNARVDWIVYYRQKDYTNHRLEDVGISVPKEYEQ